jgi:hypothetical protein
MMLIRALLAAFFFGSVGLGLIALASCEGAQVALTNREEGIPLKQSACLTGSAAAPILAPDGGPTPVVTMAPEGKGLYIYYPRATFRCEQEIVALAKRVDRKITVTFQPRELNPPTLPKCGDCVYDLQAHIEQLGGGTFEFEFYHRTDDYAGKGTTKKIAEGRVDIP